MTRLYVLVEGPTEERIAKAVLEPHLAPKGVWVHPIIVETSRDRHGRKRPGGGDWGKWRRDLLRLTGGQPGADARFTTMFDLYGLPKGFPGLAEHASVGDTKLRAELLEKALAEDIGDWRLVPYVQRHEVEALVLAGLDALETVLDPGHPGVAILRQVLLARPPEDVNDGRETAPSRRLEAAIPGYRKTVHGPVAVEGAGLPKLRAACPRFDAWIGKLEGLGVDLGELEPKAGPADG